MVMTIEATFENGVFIPAQRLSLAEHEHVRLTIEAIVADTARRLEIVRCGRERRIRVDPALAEEIVMSPEFHPFGN